MVKTVLTKRIRKKPAKKKPTVSTTVKEYVNKQIHKNIERKYASRSLGWTPINGRCTLQSDIRLIVPTISQGDANGQRNGAQITARSLVVRGHVIATFSEDKLYKRAMCARVVCLRARSARDNAVVVNEYSQLLPYVIREGSTTNYLDNSIKYAYLPINTAAFEVIYDKKFFVTNPIATGTDYAANATNCAKFFTIRVPCAGKRLKYRESADTECENFSPFLLFQYCYLDGTGGDVLNTEMGIAYTSELIYEDA